MFKRQGWKCLVKRLVREWKEYRLEPSTLLVQSSSVNIKCLSNFSIFRCFLIHYKWAEIYCVRRGQHVYFNSKNKLSQ